MIDIIKNIFQESEFIEQESDSFTLFSYSDKTSYWLVVEDDTFNFLTKQDELFKEAKILADNVPEFDKNTSLLLLCKIPDGSEIKEFKKQIMEIEEDPYQFKKQVLVYNNAAKDELDTQLMIESFSDLLSSPNTFKEYKDSYTESSWQALLFRTAQKLPFIKINVAKNKNLSSLFQNNQSALQSKSLDVFHNHITNAFEDKLATDIKDMNPEDVLNLLLTEEEKADGTENK